MRELEADEVRNMDSLAMRLQDQAAMIRSRLWTCALVVASCYLRIDAVLLLNYYRLSQHLLFCRFY